MHWSHWLTVKSKPHCDKCGWSGAKGELLIEEAGLEVRDSFSYSVQAMFGGTPSHRVEYRCPNCKELLASDLKFYQAYFDQETFED
jgi:hypothetical protein